MSKDGIARAAQALAPRVAQSFFYKMDGIHYFDIRYSLFQSFCFDLTGRFSG
jgi:hypothetical protein